MHNMYTKVSILTCAYKLPFSCRNLVPYEFSSVIEPECLRTLARKCLNVAGLVIKAIGGWRVLSFLSRGRV